MRHFLLALAFLALASPGWADVAFDAYTSELGGDGAFDHTPAGTPRAVIIFVHTGGTQTTTAVTYGGVSLTQVEYFETVNAENNFDLSLWFLGSSIPTGTQSIVTTTSAGSPNVVCYTLTASADTVIENTDITIDTTIGADPSVSLGLSGNTSWVAMSFLSGLPNVSQVTPLTNWTSRDEVDEGAYVDGFYSYDTIGSTDVTCGYTAIPDNAALLCVAVTEGAAASAPNQLMLMGVGD